MRILFTADEADTEDADAAGIRATVDDLAALDRLYRHPPGLVRAGMITSVDGAAGVHGVSGALGTPGDLRVFGALRAQADVVLVGAGTVRAEGYGQPKVNPARREARRTAGLAEVPRIAVVTGTAALDPGARLFVEDGPQPLVLTTGRADTHALDAVAEVVVCGEDTVEPTAVLAALHERGFTRVLCEGGPTLLARYLADGLIGELCLTVSPLLTGPAQLRLLGGPEWPSPLPARLRQALEEDGALFLRYRVGPPASDSAR